jgi:hypothetical protein
MDESPLPAHPRLSFLFFVFVFSIVRFLKIYKYCLQSSTHWVNAQLAIYGCDGPFALLSGWGLEGARWKDCKLDFSYLMTYLLSPVQRGFFLYISSWPMGNELFALHNTIFFIKYNFFIRTQIKIFFTTTHIKVKIIKKKVLTQTPTTRRHTHPYEHTYANPTPMSTSEGLRWQISRFMKSPQAPRCRRGHRLPLKA